MRVTQCAFAAIVAAGAATLAAGPRIQEPSGTQPVFRTGVELLTIDVTALDDRGRQVTDLSPADFAVEVDGDPRQVVSADYVRLV
ncbi:MAG: hypothetical protein OEW19_11250, partial [Acidobacteriota bacterium]|nr:hypothetical protein [Acidobacteriota bacterium]